MRKVLKILGWLAAMYAVVSGALFAAMLQSPNGFARTMKHVPWAAFMVLPFKPLWMTARSGHVHVGDAAPDFSLEFADHKVISNCPPCADRNQLCWCLAVTHDRPFGGRFPS